MIKNYLLNPFLVTFCKLFFQKANFLVVNNFTKHTFDKSPTMQFQPATRSTGGMGYVIPFNINKK